MTSTIVRKRKSVSRETYLENLRRLEHGDHVDDEALVWLFQDFQKVVDATSMFPRYNVVTVDAIHNLNRIRSYLDARGIVPPSND